MYGRLCGRRRLRSAGTTLPHLLRCQHHSLDVGAKRLPWHQSIDCFEPIALRRQCRQPLVRIKEPQLPHPPRCPIYGDGSQTRFFCYVEDLIEGLVRLLASPTKVTGPINIGNPNESSVLELSAKVVDLIGSSRIVHRPRREDDPTQRRPDISRATDLLDWKPRT